MEVKVIGQMDNTIDHTFESANRVYDVGGVSPTINTCGGGGLQPKILEDKTIVAMRGRNPDNPSDRTVGSPTEQRLEPNSQGICNTLTSVQKDNLVMEKVVIDDTYANRQPRVYEDYSPALRSEREGLKTIEVKQLGFMDNGTGKHQSNTVYDEKALCPNITTIEGGGTQQIKVMTETVHIKQATSQGYIECEVGGVADLSFPDSKTRRGRVQENGQVSPTLMAGEQDICRIENVYDFYNNNLKSDGVCGTITTQSGTSFHCGSMGVIETQYRIRKLTPLECWRLMDFTDEDFEKAAQVNSNTQLYKQAGNSIVKNVLVAILGQMIPGKEEVYKNI